MKETFRCEHGINQGPLIFCELPSEETGARPAWKRKVDSRLIVTPFWCENKCRRHQELVRLEQGEPASAT